MIVLRMIRRFCGCVKIHSKFWNPTNLVLEEFMNDWKVVWIIGNDQADQQRG